MGVQSSFDYGGLRAFLIRNALEIVFKRRHEKAGATANRRMFCTLTRPLLNSMGGKIGLHFTAPTGRPAYNASHKNLLVAWDIIMQDWRSIPLESVEIVNVVANFGPKQQEEFWAYFEAQFAQMSTQAKKTWMNA